MTRSIGILGTGSYVPDRVVTNAEVAALVDVPEEWIAKKTDIVARRYAAPEEATSDLAAKAAAGALDQAGITADRLDYIIVSTSTPDSPQPPTSYHLQRALKADNAACFDINVVCSGFVYALHLARGLISQHPGARVLVAASDLYSRILDFSDRRTAVLLGDGAGAVVVGETAEGSGFLGVELVSRGEEHRLIRVEAGGSRQPLTPTTVEEGGHFFRMEGRGVRDFVMENFPPVVDRIAARVGIPKEEILHFVPHQPNGVLLTELVKRCGLAHATTHRTLERYGNVGSASVAVTLDEANRSGALKDGELTLLGCFGGGMSMAATVLRWAVPA